MKTQTRQKPSAANTELVKHVLISPKTHARLRKFCLKRGLKLSRAVDQLVRAGMRGAV